MKTRHIALTGSIGMGKSTTAAMFEELGVPVWDADAAVHRLYAFGQKGWIAVRELCEEAANENGVDRPRLAEELQKNPKLLKRLEAAIHPLVQKEREDFKQGATGPLTLCDIPLLFETGAEDEFATVITVTAPENVQRSRVLSREGMTGARFTAILKRQLPDAEKRKRADYVIDTSQGLEATRLVVKDIFKKEMAKANA